MDITLVYRKDCTASNVMKNIVREVSQELDLPLTLLDIEEDSTLVTEAPSLLFSGENEKALSGYHPKDRVIAFLTNT